MDLSESIKRLSKTGNGSDGAAAAARGAGAGYVTEKLYMLLQLYLQNKGWSPSVELLQCFQELKDSPILPSPAYLQVIANRVNLDSQGRLILRENGKIVLPYEHFGNAVMLKHMQGGPHGPHLSVEQTVRAVMESYTIGRENFGMEKEFIIDIVKSCPNCRYYKSLPNFMDQPFPAAAAANQLNADYMAHLQQIAAAGIDISALDPNNTPTLNTKMSKPSNPPTPRMDSQQAQITAAIIQQQNRAIAQQTLDKNFVNMFPLEKQRLLQHYEKHQQQQQQQYEKQQQVQFEKQQQYEKQQQAQFEKQQQAQAQAQFEKQQQQLFEKAHPVISVGLSSGASGSSSSSSVHSISASVPSAGSAHNMHQPQPPSTPSGQTLPPTSHLPPVMQSVVPPPPRCVTPATPHDTKSTDYYRANLEAAFDAGAGKDLLSLHSGAWTIPAVPAEIRNPDGSVVGQEKIVRTFAELIRKMGQMKQYIRPTLCESFSGLYSA